MSKTIASKEIEQGDAAAGFWLVVEKVIVYSTWFVGKGMTSRRMILGCLHVNFAGTRELRKMIRDFNLSNVR